jgi:hypothetical protein
MHFTILAIAATPPIQGVILSRTHRLETNNDAAPRGRMRAGRHCLIAGVAVDCRVMSAGMIQVIENLLTPELHKSVWEVCCAKRWYFGNHSVSTEEPGFWKMDLDGDSIVKRAWMHAKTHCEPLVGRQLKVVRQYANGHRSTSTTNESPITR